MKNFANLLYWKFEDGETLHKVEYSTYNEGSEFLITCLDTEYEFIPSFVFFIDLRDKQHLKVIKFLEFTEGKPSIYEYKNNFTEEHIQILNRFKAIFYETTNAQS